MEKALNVLLEKIEKIEKHLKQTSSYTHNYDEVNSENILLDTNQVCELLNICDRTLWKLRKNHLINYTYQGKKCIYTLSEIERIIINHVITSDIKTISELHSKFFSQSK